MVRAPASCLPPPTFRSGYSIIELLVVVSITILMASILLAYNHSSERELSLAISQAKLVGLASRAKAYALEKYAGRNVDPNACGFGVHFDSASPGTVTLFEDRPFVSDEGCRSADGAENFFNAVYDTGEEVESITFDRGVTAESLEGDIAFIAPYLKVYANGIPLSAPVTITLRRGTEASLDVTVGVGGDIAGR